jgi:hypothetical protein
MSTGALLGFLKNAEYRVSEFHLRNFRTAELRGGALLITSGITERISKAT